MAIGAATFAADAPKNVIPKIQEPISKTFPPAAAEQTKPGVGKFVIFTREATGKDWDFIARAWECIPSQPKSPITKRVEFCHSSWNADALLDEHPRFVRLPVDSHDDDHLYVNLYDIDYQSWTVRHIWRGPRLNAIGTVGASIFCNVSKDLEKWLLLDAKTAAISEGAPFVPVDEAGDFWLVRKNGETEADGIWSYDRTNQAFVGHFAHVEIPDLSSFEAKLSPDGKTRISLIATAPLDWLGGVINGVFRVQRHGKAQDITVPVTILAQPGSGIHVLPRNSKLEYISAGKARFRSKIDPQSALENFWTVNIFTGEIASGLEIQMNKEKKSDSVAGGILVPEYLREQIKHFPHFGRSGLGPAFLMHLGLLTTPPEYPDCTTAVSPDGRHILFAARKGPLHGEFIYGDLVTKKTERWKIPKDLDARVMKFVWVVTP